MTSNMIPQKTWILDWIRQHGEASVVNQDFHDEAAERFGWKQRLKYPGACPCPRAMYYLQQMYKEALLDRQKVSLPGTGSGFPNWVYLYRIPESD